MFFTQEDYNKIYNWIKLHSIKDSEFSDAKPLDGREIITVVQQGYNVKFFLKEFLKQLSLLNIPDFVNVTDRYNLSYISLFEAIKVIPYRSRKIGQVITFIDEDGNWKIYQFRGERKNQWNILSLWTDILQDIIDKSGALPDEEDLTAIKEGDKTIVKFKDKAYNPDNFSGKGRVYLRKNIVEIIDYNTKVKVTKNLLTQSMISKENTIYIIQYDYDLNGQTIIIPKGCILQFEGGSFRNGGIKGIDTVISTTGIYRIFYNIRFEGTFTNTIIYPEYFGAAGNDNIDCTNSINEAADLCRLLDGELKFFDGIYKVTDTIDLSAINIDGNGTIIKGYIGEQKAIINIDPRLGSEWSSFSKRTRFIRNIRVDCNSQDNIGIRVYGDGQIFTNIHIREVGWLGFYSFQSGNATLNDFLIEGSDKSLDFSVGLALEAPDWQVSNGVIQNVATGVISSCNFFNNIHTWGYNTRHPMYVHLLVIYNQRCYVSNWYFDTITTSSPDNSEHPSWILENNTDVKRRRYVGNTAILCLGTGNVYLNTCRTYQAPGQTLEGVTPIFLCNESTSVNKIVNTFITEGFVKYSSDDSLSKYIVNDNDFNIVVLSKASSDVLIKLYDFDQVYDYNSIIFDIETSCNGIPVIAKVASYYNVDNDTITVTPLIDNISDIKDYTNRYNVRFYKTEKSLYYRCTTEHSYNNIYIIKYNNALKNITPVISTDSVNSAQEVQSYYSNYAYSRWSNTGIATLKDVGTKSIIRLCKADSIPEYNTEYYDIVFSLNTAYLRLGISVYSGNNQYYYTIFPYCREIGNDITISGCVYNGYIYIEILSSNSYVKTFYIQNYTKLTETVPIIDNSIDINSGTPATLYDYTYNNGLTDQKSIGYTPQRPTALNDKNIGFEYFDTTLNKSIWWNGAKWVGSDGNDADSPMSGSFADRPTGVKAGYSYFCTDKQTTEGSTNGIMIYYRGSNTWVDALGRVVS